LTSEDVYEQAYVREKRARQRAEEIIEERNRTIYHLRKDLLEASEKLDSQEESIMQADKLKSVGLLASGITHEINNPLAYITSNLKVLKEYFDITSTAFKAYSDAGASEIPEDTREKLRLAEEDAPEIFRDISTGLERIGDIVSSVKRFARKNSKERDLASINQEIKTSLELVQKQLGPKTRVSLELSDLPLVGCNIREIGQVLINLIINADQASADGGNITIRSACEGKCVLIRVIDQGSGIPEDAIDHIFDPFFTTKPVGEGTGLGLSVSYGIVEDHGGRIAVSSEIGKGSEFTVVLPVN